LVNAKEFSATNPTDFRARFRVAAAQYAITKFIRRHNSPAYAAYLGYLSARELYPDFDYRSFVAFVDELVAGTVERPYALVDLKG